MWQWLDLDPVFFALFAEDKEREQRGHWERVQVVRSLALLSALHGSWSGCGGLVERGH